MITMKKIAAAVVLATAAMGAQAAPVATGGVFTMYSQAGLDTAGVVPFPAVVNVDPSVTGFVDQAAGTWGVASTALFFGLNWTASGGSLITGAGSYALDTTTGAVSSATSCGSGTMCFNVGAGQVAGTINFAYGATTGIRVINVWDVGANGSLTAKVVPGMENGPFPGFNAAFNLTAPGLIAAVPEAETYAMMLAGLGLIGTMVGRRRKTMA